MVTCAFVSARSHGNFPEVRAVFNAFVMSCASFTVIGLHAISPAHETGEDPDILQQRRGFVGCITKHDTLSCISA